MTDLQWLGFVVVVFAITILLPIHEDSVSFVLNVLVVAVLGLGILLLLGVLA